MTQSTVSKKPGIRDRENRVAKTFENLRVGQTAIGVSRALVSFVEVDLSDVVAHKSDALPTVVSLSGTHDCLPKFITSRGCHKDLSGTLD